MRKINLPIKLVKKLIDPLFNKEIRDKQFVVDSLMAMLPDYQLEMFIEISNRTKFNILSKGEHVKFKPTGYFLDDYDEDILIDKGLYKDGYVYAYIVEDDSYSSTFNPYSHKMKVFVYLWKGDELEMNKVSINTLELISSPKCDIPYFKLSVEEDEEIIQV
tara:strand:+ start:4186 stop:4668 length:483 start_codon:yes stop_codon:yes gene_type:complete